MWDRRRALGIVTRLDDSSLAKHRLEGVSLGFVAVESCRCWFDMRYEFMSLAVASRRRWLGGEGATGRLVTVSSTCIKRNQARVKTVASNGAWLCL